MARMPTHYIEVSGPLFESHIVQLFKGAVHAGIADIADETDDIMMAQIVAGGMVDSGALMRSVDIMLVRSSMDVVGYAAVAPTDTWRGTLTIQQTGTVKKTNKRGKTRRVKVYSRSATTSAGSNRPTHAWLIKGMRGGKKLRPGYNFYSRTATAVKRLDYNGMVGKHIMGVLE